MTDNLVVTIARQYGSGGREVGEKLAKEMNMAYYDESLIKLAAEKSGMSLEALENVDERATPSLLYAVAMGSAGMMPFNYGMLYETPLNDKLFAYQSQIIKEEAAKGPSVFIGRCADFVLEGHPKLVRVFIYADLDKRAQTIAARKEIEVGEAKNLAVKTDKKRASYYNYYTSRKWGRIENYDVMIDTAKIGIDGAVKVIQEYIKNLG
ncbi:MAG: AAA family ATPase [Eubacteriales bacterium]